MPELYSVEWSEVVEPLPTVPEGYPLELLSGNANPQDYISRPRPGMDTPSEPGDFIL